VIDIIVTSCILFVLFCSIRGNIGIYKYIFNVFIVYSYQEVMIRSCTYVLYYVFIVCILCTLYLCIGRISILNLSFDMRIQRLITRMVHNHIILSFFMSRQREGMA